MATIWHMSVIPEAGEKADVTAWAEGMSDLPKSIHQLLGIEFMSKEPDNPNKLDLSFEVIYAWFDRIQNRQRNDKAKRMISEEREKVRKFLDTMQPFQLKCSYANSVGYKIKIMDVNDSASVQRPSSPSFSGSMWVIDVQSISNGKVRIVVKGMSDPPVPKRHHLLESVGDLQRMDAKRLEMSVDQLFEWWNRLRSLKMNIPKTQAKLGEGLDEAMELVRRGHPFSMAYMFMPFRGYMCVVKEAKGHKQAPPVEKEEETYIPQPSDLAWRMEVKPPRPKSKFRDVTVKVGDRAFSKRHTPVLPPLDDFSEAEGFLKVPLSYMEGTNEVFFFRMFQNGKMTSEEYNKIKELLGKRVSFEVACYSPAKDKYAFRVKKLEVAPSKPGDIRPGDETGALRASTREKGQRHQAEAQLAKLAKHNRTLKEKNEELNWQLTALAKRIKESKDVSSELQQAQKQVEQLKAEKETLEESLRQVEDSEELQEKLDQVRSEVDALYQQWRDRYQKNERLMKGYIQAVRDLGSDEDVSIPGMKDAEGINDRIGELHQSLRSMNPQTFAFKSWDVFVEYQEIQRAMATLKKIRWDSVLIHLLKRLPETVRIKKISPIDEIPPTLETFVASRGFELIWPARGDELSLSEHRILDELKDDEVGRRKVIRAVTPGLRRNNDVKVKAAIYLAK